MNSEFWKGKKVFLTGHTGFKGSWLSLWLQKMQAQVTGYSLAPPTEPSLFDRANVAEGMTSIIGDIRDRETLKQAVVDAQPDIIIHMAAQPLVKRSYVDPIETYETNVMGTAHILEGLKAAKSAKVFVNVTTDKVYHNNEWEWGYREHEPFGGFDPYSNSKACSELVTQSYRDSWPDMPGNQDYTPMIATARAGNVIGGGDWAADRLIPDCIKTWSEKNPVQIRFPNSIRPWQHVLEPLSGYLMLCEKLWEEGDVYASGWNFGPNDTDACTVGYIVEELGQLWSTDVKWELDNTDHPHEANYLKLDISKAKMKLGWGPRWDLDRTLKSIADWYQTFLENPEQVRQITEAQIMAFEETPILKAQ